MRARLGGMVKVALAAWMAASAQAADSVFVDRAFQGTWKFTQSNGQSGGFVTFTQVDEATGSAQINTFADANFNVNNCPPVPEKREYYSAIDESGFQGSFCTNGSKMVGRFRDRINNVTVYQTIAFTVTRTSPPTLLATGTTDGSPAVDTATGVAIGGQIATPLARLANVWTVTAASPLNGTTVAPGKSVTFDYSVTYRLGSADTGTLRATLFDGQQAIQTTPPVGVTFRLVEQSQTFTFNNVVIPSTSVLRVRLEMVPTGASAPAAMSEVFYPVLSSPKLKATPDVLSWNPYVNSFLAGWDLYTTVASQGPFTATLQGRYPWALLNPLLNYSLTSDTLPPVYRRKDGIQVAVAVYASVGNAWLPVGYYSDSLVITSGNETITVPINMTVRPNNHADTQLDLSTGGFRITARQGQGSSAGYKVGVATRVYSTTPSTVADPPLDWIATVIRGAELIRIDSPTMSADPLPGRLGAYRYFTVTLAPGVTNQSGSKTALIAISSRSMNNTTLYVSVTIDVLPDASEAEPLFSSQSSLAASLAEVKLQGVEGGPDVSETINMDVSELAPLSTAVAALTSNGKNWLTASLDKPQVSTEQRDKITVTASPRVAGGVGNYGGTVNVRVGNVVRSLRVTLTVSRAALSEPARNAVCIPSQVSVFEGSLPNSFSTPVGVPQVLTVRLVDDCGSPVENGSATASFNNGDRPLTLQSAGIPGTFVATWIPSHALLGSTDVTLRGSSAGLEPGQLDISGTVTVNANQRPVLAADGILNNLNPIVGAPLVPGTVVQIYGDNLASVSESVPAVPLPTQYKGTEVLVGGYSAPLYYVSPGQLVAQLPTELKPDQKYSAVVVVNGAASAPLSLTTIGVLPGVAALSDGKLIAQHGSNYQLVSAANPARPGEALIMYLVGMGATNPAVASGIATPSDRLYQAVVQPVVTVDGQRADVPFAGLTPGGVGLYQINFVVPANAASGDLDVVITQDATKANETKLVVRK